MDEPVTAAAPLYPGADWSRQTADEQTIAVIPAKLRRSEARLYSQKWYDYRRLHPMVATLLFVEHYRKAYSAAVTKCFDVVRGPYSLGVTKDWLGKRERGSFWQLRQQADALGIPYGPFLHATLNHYLDHCAWMNLPRPQHLLQPDALAAAATHWNDLCRTRLQVPTDGFYRVDAFIGHPYQIECKAWLIEQAQRRPEPKYALAALIYDYACARESDIPARYRGDVEALRGSLGGCNVSAH